MKTTHKQRLLDKYSLSKLENESQYEPKVEAERE